MNRKRSRISSWQPTSRHGLLPLAVVALLANASAQDWLIQGATLVVAPDTVMQPGELLIRDGKVAHVGPEIPAEVRSRARALRFDGGWIVPGFVLAHATLAQESDLVERAVSWTPELMAAEAFDPFHEDLAELPQNAVTSCLLAPSSANVAGGIAALVKPGEEFGRIAAEDAYLKLALTTKARDQQREPTSLMGAVSMLRTALQNAKAGMPGEPGNVLLQQVLQGQRPVFVHAENFAELSAILDMADEFEFEPVLVGAGAAKDCLDRIAKSRARIALRAMRPESRQEQLELPAQLEARGIPFCFVGSPAELRLTAALAVRHGTSRKAALAAITRVPAELTGQQELTGSLRRGCSADFAVFGGDPLDLASPLLAVFVDDKVLYGKAPQPTAPGPNPVNAEESR